MTIMMNANNLAWMKGAAAFTPGDTVDDAKEKAAEQGYRPYADGYAAFITAFAREVRLHRAETPKKSSSASSSAKENYRSSGLAAA